MESAKRQHFSSHYVALRSVKLLIHCTDYLRRDYRFSRWRSLYASLTCTHLLCFTHHSLTTVVDYSKIKTINDKTLALSYRSRIVSSVAVCI